MGAQIEHQTGLETKALRKTGEAEYGKQYNYNEIFQLNSLKTAYHPFKAKIKPPVKL